MISKSTNLFSLKVTRSGSCHIALWRAKTKRGGNKTSKPGLSGSGSLEVAAQRGTIGLKKSEGQNRRINSQKTRGKRKNLVPVEVACWGSRCSETQWACKKNRGGNDRGEQYSTDFVSVEVAGWSGSLWLKWLAASFYRRSVDEQT